MDLKQLEYIIAIAEEHSISRAAQRFYLSPSALSQYLKRLEESEQPPPLFYRRNRVLYLTDAVRIYVNGALTILSLAKKQERSRPQELSSLRIAVPSYLESFILTQCIPAFASSFPTIQAVVCALEPEEARKALSEGKLEAAVLMEQKANASSVLYSRPLSTDRIVLAVSAASASVLPDIDSCSFIMPAADTLWHMMCRAICLEENLQPSSFCQNGNFHACADLICQNSSVVPLAAFLPDRVFCEWADKRNGLKEFPLSHSYPYYITFSVLSGTAMHKHVLETLFQLLSFAFKDK